MQACTTCAQHIEHRVRVTTNTPVLDRYAFRKRGAKGTGVLPLDTFVSTELAEPIARGLLAPATLLTRYGSLGFVHLLRVGLAPLASLPQGLK